MEDTEPNCLYTLDEFKQIVDGIVNEYYFDKLKNIIIVKFDNKGNFDPGISNLVSNPNSTSFLNNIDEKRKINLDLLIKRQLWAIQNKPDLNKLITSGARKEAKQWGINIEKITVTDFSQMRSIRLFNEGSNLR